MPTRLTQTGAEVQDDLYKIEDIDLATEEKAGLMSPGDKTKLDNIDAEIPTKLSDLEDDATHRLVTDTEKATWNNKSDFDGRYDSLIGRPYIPQRTSDLRNDSGFITNVVNNLVNYYLKSEVYTKDQVDQIVSTVGGFTVRVVDVLPTASEETMRALYLVPSADPEAGNVKDEWITIENTGTYSWERIGSTATDLDGYVTDDELTAALQGYVTSTAFATALAGKQDVIQDLESIRAGATAGASAYQKPQSGIPASDLASGVIPDVSGFYEKPSGGIPSSDMSSAVQTSLGKADTAYQLPSGGIPEIDLAQAVATKLNATEIFWATYGTTAISDIVSAIEGGKFVVLLDGVYWYILVKNDAPYYYFLSWNSTTHRMYRMNANTNNWSTYNYSLEKSDNKKTTLTGNESSDTYYPTTKAVADYVADKAEIFMATFGVTSYQDVERAISSRQTVVMTYRLSDILRYYYVTGGPDADDMIYFGTIFKDSDGNTVIGRTYVEPSGWGALTFYHLDSGDGPLVSDPSSYPNASIVYDALSGKVDTASSLSDSDWNYILADPVPPLPFYIFTEDFEEYDPDDYALDNGYNDWTDMASGIATEPELLQYTGAQMFADTGDTIEYDGETYHLFQMYAGHDENYNWAPVEGLYGLVSGDTTLAFLQSKIPQQAGDILNDPYVPIVAVADQDNNIYSDDPGMVYTLIYAMARTI